MNILTVLLALITSAVGGYYFTRLVLHLAQKKYQEEQSETAQARKGRKVSRRRAKRQAADAPAAASEDVSKAVGSTVPGATVPSPTTSPGLTASPGATSTSAPASPGAKAPAPNDHSSNIRPDGAHASTAQSDASDVTGSPINGPDSLQAQTALRGGMWIGILERVLIAGFILAGQFAGVAVVVAIKGLGRYPELNNQTSERFIIGTLASLFWACLCGWGGQWIIHTVL